MFLSSFGTKKDRCPGMTFSIIGKSGMTSKGDVGIGATTTKRAFGSKEKDTVKFQEGTSGNRPPTAKGVFGRKEKDTEKFQDGTSGNRPPTACGPTTKIAFSS
ncbi:hypothetical protein QYF36_011630 [Acer negundo]|nr:hypothetical protein QYF36_011630 [Acer negundo]